MQLFVRDDGHGPPSKPSGLGGPGASSTITSTSTTAETTATPTNAASTDSQSSPTATSTVGTGLTATDTTLNASITPSGTGAPAPSGTAYSQGAGLASTSNAPAIISPATDAELGSAQASDDRAMSNGAIAAAVVVPLLVLALLAALIFLLYRRRRRQQTQRAAMFVQNMTQRPPSQPIREHYNLGPVAVGAPITGYYTGLDTTEHAERQSTSFSDEPPPPYGNKAAAAIPLINAPAERSETHSSISWRTAPQDAEFLGAADAERQSISSTAYTDNASLHSARAARMSVGGANVITTTMNRDPFHDPESPVSSVDGDDDRYLHGRDISRVVSPVSMSSRRLA